MSGDERHSSGTGPTEPARRPVDRAGTPLPAGASLPQALTPGEQAEPASSGSYPVEEENGYPPGTVLGKYKLVRRLGAGGMGAVYEAVHMQIGKPVALKTLSAALAGDARNQARFMREAAAASRLDHPHVVQVTDFASDLGVSYLVMELLRGEDLAAALEREPNGLSVEFVADVMLAVCAGVFAAHEVGVVHRDLKPQNIFLARTPLGELLPKVLDFGISKLVDATTGSLTNTGTVIGTTHYLSPEQVTGRNVDGRSDQYALGVILYECLTGQRPHQGDTIFVIMRSIGDGAFAPPRTLRPDLPEALEAIILRAMSINAQDRFESVHALGRALLPFASPKRRLLWSDYYDNARPPVGQAAPGADGSTPLPRLGTGPGGTHPLEALPGLSAGAGSAPTRTKARAGDSSPSVDTRSGVAPVPVSTTRDVMRPASAGRWKPVALALGVAGLVGVAFLLFSPGRKPAVPIPGSAGRPAPGAVADRNPEPPQSAPVALPSGAPAPRPSPQPIPQPSGQPAPGGRIGGESEGHPDVDRGTVPSTGSSATKEQDPPRGPGKRSSKKKRPSPRDTSSGRPGIQYNGGGVPILE